jgi:hypothetical protein
LSAIFVPLDGASSLSNWATAALAYLAIPVAIFWTVYVPGWIGWCCVIAMALWWLLLPADGGGIFRYQNADRKSVGVAIVGALLVLWVMGFPSGPWAWDWFKHWALIGVLSEQSWPVHVTLDGEMWSLRFYLAAYVVPAMASKLFPILGLELPTALWFGLGVGLLLQLIMCLRPIASWSRQTPWSRLQSLSIPVIFLAMAGADAVVDILMRTVVGYANPGLGLHTEWWALDWLGTNLQLSGILAALAWVPHQSIATMIVAVTLLVTPERQPPWRATLGLALLALWSPLGVIGLMPLWLWQLWASKEVWLSVSRAGGIMLAGAFLLLPVTFVTTAFLAVDTPRIGISLPSPDEVISRLSSAVFVMIVELGPCAAILGKRIVTTPLFRVCGLTILAIVMLADNQTPDFAMRATAGPLAILLASASASFVARFRDGTSAMVFSLMGLALALPSSMSEVVYHLDGGAIQGSLPDGDPGHSPSRRDFVNRSNVSVSAFFDACGWRYVPQYFARRVPLVDDK